MTDRALDRAVAALLEDRRLFRRFRRSPERALRRFGLSASEIEAVKSGRADDLLALGLDPSFVWPRVPEPARLEPWLLRNARRLAPAAFVAVLMAWPATAGAQRLTPPGRLVAGRRIARRAALRRTGLRRASVRASARALGLRRAGRRAGATGLRQALRRVGPPLRRVAPPVKDEPPVVDRG